MIIGIVMIIVATIILILNTSDKYRRHSQTVIETFGIILMSVGICLMTAGFFTYPVSYNTVANLEAFYENTDAVYKDAIHKYGRSAVILRTSDGANTYKTYPGIYTEKIEWYNRKLKYYHKWQNHWFIRGFITKVSKDLKPIITMPDVSNQ